MRIKLIILTLLYLFFGVRFSFADSPPAPLSPQNNSTITQTSPKLSWEYYGQCYSGGSCFYTEVSDSESFSSIAKYTYTNNKYYSPQNLAYKKWFWRVKAKDTTGTWSAMSEIWSFTISNSSSSPTPTSTSTPIPASPSTPTPIPSSVSTSSFTISNTPTQINSDQSFTVSVNLSLTSKPNTTFYLKGAFKNADGSNYFGLTKVLNNWIKNGSSYSSQYQITTDPSGNWPGNLDIMVDVDDSGYTGNGDYIFKIGRYDTSGNGPTWSNEVTVHINNVESSQDSSSNTQSSSKTTVSPSPSSSAVLSKSSPSISQSKPTKIASVAGVSKTATSSTSPTSSPSANIKVAQQKQFNPFVLVGIIFIIAGIGSLGYLVYRKKVKI